MAVVLFPKQGIRFDLGVYLPLGIEKDVIPGFGLVCKTLQNTKKIKNIVGIFDNFSLPDPRETRGLACMCSSLLQP